MLLRIKEVKVRKSEKAQRTRVYFFLEGETMLENLFHRHNRPYREYRKLLKEVFAIAGITPEKANWNQYAGCSCGCSPGFILTGDNNKDIFVTIEEVKEV